METVTAKFVQSGRVENLGHPETGRELRGLLFKLARESMLEEIKMSGCAFGGGMIPIVFCPETGHVVVWDNRAENPELFCFVSPKYRSA